MLSQKLPNTVDSRTADLHANPRHNGDRRRSALWQPHQLEEMTMTRNLGAVTAETKGSGPVGEGGQLQGNGG